MGYSNKKKSILGREFSDEEETKLINKIGEKHTTKSWNMLSKKEKLGFIDSLYDGEDTDEKNV